LSATQTIALEWAASAAAQTVMQVSLPREPLNNFSEPFHVLFHLANLLIQDFDYSFLFGKKNLVPSSALVEPFDPLGLCHSRFTLHCVTAEAYQCAP